VIEPLLVLAFGILTAAFVTRPFRSGWAVSGFEDPRVADLEARRDSKFREIKDTEADLKSGKITSEDFDRVRADADRRPDGNG
jgi:hypothetical protein